MRHTQLPRHARYAAHCSAFGQPSSITARRRFVVRRRVRSCDSDPSSTHIALLRIDTNLIQHRAFVQPSDGIQGTHVSKLSISLSCFAIILSRCPWIRTCDALFSCISVPVAKVGAWHVRVRSAGSRLVRCSPVRELRQTHQSLVSAPSATRLQSDAPSPPTTFRSQPAGLVVVVRGGGGGGGGGVGGGGGGRDREVCPSCKSDRSLSLCAASSRETSRIACAITSLLFSTGREHGAQYHWIVP